MSWKFFTAQGQEKQNLVGGISSVGYGTSFPVSPTDGQEYVLVDNVANPTYQWRFRYNAGSSSAYKWEYVGGTDVYVNVETNGQPVSGSFAAMGSAGPSFTLPRAGDYKIAVGAQIQSGVVAGGGSPAGCVISYDIGATPANDSWGAIFQALNSSAYAAVVREYVHTGVAASSQIVGKYRWVADWSGGIAGQVMRRWIRVTPYRCS